MSKARISIIGSGMSRRLTPLAPQPLHKTGKAYRFSLVRGFERIFRNEGVTGSNPVSST
jgi:hypothetical protein